MRERRKPRFRRLGHAVQLLDLWTFLVLLGSAAAAAFVVVVVSVLVLVLVLVLSARLLRWWAPQLAVRLILHGWALLRIQLR